jgi:hypothetical protein
MSRPRKRTERRRLERELRKVLPLDEEFVLVGADEVAVNVPGSGVIFFTQPPELGGDLLVESIAHSGPGVAERKLVLEEMLREAGYGKAIDEAKRRREMAS